MTIEIEDLHKAFGRHEALRGLSLAVPEGSAYALIGANGAGKTTAIKTLMNIITPTRGVTRIVGVDSRRLGVDQLRQIGYVSENQDMPSRMTVGQYVEYLRPFYPQWDRDLEGAVLAELRLPLERKIGDLSHGMRMKLSLACALPFRPRVLVLDEPFSGLDPLVRDEFMERLLQQAGEMTILISSHELLEIEGLISHVGFLDQGKLMFQESMAQLSDRFRAVRLTLESPMSCLGPLPEGWLQLTSTGNVVSFFDTRFSDARLSTAVPAVFQGVRYVDVQPVALRTIYDVGACCTREWLTMTLHILKKDIRLLGAIAALVAGLHLSAAIPHYVLDHSVARSVQLQIIADLLSALAILGMIVMVVIAIHQDPVPGVRQDWLTRPIRRRDLLLAKLLFVILMVQGPMWLVDVGTALVAGQPLPAALLRACARNLAVFCEFSLPAMVIAVITRSFVEAFVAATIGFLVYVFVFGLILAILLGATGPVPASSISWVFDAILYALMIVAAVVTLSLQYFGRRTTLSRWLAGAGGALIIACAFLPWNFAFGLQEKLSAEPQAARSVEIATDSRRGRYLLRRDAAPYLAAALFSPLRISGLPQESNLLLDYAQIHVTSADGTLLYEGGANMAIDGLAWSYQQQFQAQPQAPAARDPGMYQRFYLPAAVTARAGKQPVKIGIDYSLTLVKPAQTYSMAAVGGSETLGVLGRCTTRIADQGDGIVITCLSTSRQPSCVAMHLEDPVSGLRDGETGSCVPSYGPALIVSAWPDALSRRTWTLRFFDPAGFTHYPIAASGITAARVAIRTFVASDHFTRHLDLPATSISDLAGVAAAP